MILINTSDSLAQILPQVHHYLDPDTPIDHDLPLAIRRYLRTLLLRTFRQVLSQEPIPDLSWILVLKRDPALQALVTQTWSDVEVVDTQGTFFLIIEE